MTGKNRTDLKAPEPALGSPSRQAAQDRRLQLRLGENLLHYQLARTPRRSIVIQATPEGIRVRAPRKTALREIEAFMRAQQGWIERRLAEHREHREFAWVSGAELPLLGCAVRIAPVRGLRSIAKIDNILGLPPSLPESRYREAILEWIRSQAQALFRGRVAEYAQALGVPTPALRLSNARTRWGSCARGPDQSRVSLHWKLYLLPPALIDYVVAHEVAHLREMNHSTRFWAVVERICPGYRSVCRELNRLGRALPPI